MLLLFYEVCSNNKDSEVINSSIVKRSSDEDKWTISRVPQLFSTNDKRIDLWLIGLFPFEGSWPGGRGQVTAIDMALRDVNNADILPGYRLRMTVNDTKVFII